MMWLLYTREARLKLATGTQYVRVQYNSWSVRKLETLEKRKQKELTVVKGHYLFGIVKLSKFMKVKYSM